ncbi:Glycosyl transferase family 2 [Sphingomonas gellani]|uniref:Glycosyl transferase family 2 n=1 Tax=Sphingomonas gellani TaxID=1166340 RepID=A0A1H8I4F6_9SPHN|nr:glycosyltransferase [Sphingomonas gellani]SEN62906.1 Glycosyl transferase family 2 [Sphingomonas gellani]
MTVTSPVSIVIPCYNRAALVGEAIESALANGDGAEIIVVDDGSTDASWDRISAFSGRIRSFRIPNSGVSAARNFGVEQAKGAFIKFLDSDDRLPAGAVQALLQAQSDLAPQQIVFGDASSIGPMGEAIVPFGYGYAGLAPNGAMSRAALLSGTMSPYLPLYPIKALHLVGGFNPTLSLGEDQELAVRISLAGFQFFRIPFVVAEVREHLEDRLSRTGDADIYRRQVCVANEILRHLCSETSSITQDEILSFARTIWILGRDAARRRFEVESRQLFRISTDIAGPVQAAPVILRPFYKIVDPYKMEKVLDLIKRVIRRTKS